MKAKLLALSIISSFWSLEAQISGNILNLDNTPIPNALVSLSSNRTIWTKSDENGLFEINAQLGDQLRIAALNYETIETYDIDENTSTITLQEDVLLSTDVYHISFDHLRPGDYYSLDELKNDFTVAYGKGFYDGSTEESNRAAVDIVESVDENGSSLRVKYPQGKLKTSESGVDTRIYLSGNYKTGTEFTADELYVSYWVKYDNNFDFKCGGKMPSLGGEFENSIDGGNERWKGRTMWRNGGSIQFYPELPHSFDSFDHDSLRFWGDKEYDGGDICTNEFTPYLTNGEWHNIELHYVVDDGNPNGLFEGWVDGGKGHKVINSEVFGLYRRPGEGLDNLTINFIMISTFFGGSSVDYEPDQDVYAWYDEFRVSPTRIDEYSKYQSVVTEIASQQFTNEIRVSPNPSSNGIFTVENVSDWSVTSIDGKSIATGTSNTIDLSEARSGVYILQIDQSKTKLIIN